MLTRPLCAYAHVPQCAHLYVYCMFVCQWVSMRPHRSQLQSTVKVNFYLILTLFSGLSTGSLTSPLDMDRHSQVALSDCYHCLPTLPTHTFPSLSVSPQPHLLLSLSSAFGWALTWLSLWVCFAGQPSACYSSPALIKEENWNPFNQIPPTLPRIAVHGEHGRGRLHTPKWL